MFHRDAGDLRALEPPVDEKTRRVNHADPGRVREAYGDSVYDRLVDVKTTYDPDNVFHHNQNIRSGVG